MKPQIQTKLAERLARLRKLITINAPDIMIRSECEMVLECYRGGYIRAGVALIYHGFEKIFGWYILTPLGHACCKLGIHDYEDCFNPNTGATTSECNRCLKARS